MGIRVSGLGLKRLQGNPSHQGHPLPPPPSKESLNARAAGEGVALVTLQISRG